MGGWVGLKAVLRMAYSFPNYWDLGFNIFCVEMQMKNIRTRHCFFMVLKGKMNTLGSLFSGGGGRGGVDVYKGLTLPQNYLINSYFFLQQVNLITAFTTIHQFNWNRDRHRQRTKLERKINYQTNKQKYKKKVTLFNEEIRMKERKKH